MKTATRRMGTSWRRSPRWSVLYAQLESAGWWYGGHRYVLSDAGMGWTQAETYAQSLGGHVVNIGDAVEQQWLKQSFGSLGTFWIGLTDRPSKYLGVGGRREVAGYTNWGSGEAEQSGEFVLRLRVHVGWALVCGPGQLGFPRAH